VPNYTKSKDGKLRCTIRIEIRLPQEEVQWVAEHLGVSENTAVKLMSKILALRGTPDNRTWAVEDKTLLLVSYDDAEWYAEKGGVYLV
jgi:hypothetical protein